MEKLCFYDAIINDNIGYLWIEFNGNLLAAGSVVEWGRGV